MNQVILHRRAADRVKRQKAIQLQIYLIDSIKRQAENPKSKTARDITAARAGRLLEALADVMEAKDVTGKS